MRLTGYIECSYCSNSIFVDREFEFQSYQDEQKLVYCKECHNTSKLVVSTHMQRVGNKNVQNANMKNNEEKV